jgi:ubiquinone biosynthesis protein
LAIAPLRPVLKTILNPIVRSSLRKRMGPVEVEHLLDRTWKLYPTYLSSIVPALLGVGPALVLRLAACTAAVHAALVESGKTHEEAIRITADVGWAVYRWMGRIPWMLSGIVSSDPRKRLALSTEIFRSFPFSSPAYGWRNKSAPEGVVAFDCVRCPVAEYFSANGLSDLCVQTFCNLDFPLAKEWGAELERTSSIAAGASLCDFRWRSKSSR